MSLNDKTRGRRTYSFSRSVPQPITESTTTTTINIIEGTMGSLTWNVNLATDAAIGQYATWAEVTAAIGTTVAPFCVQVIGAAEADVAGTYDYGHVIFWSSNPSASITFNVENVIIQNAKWKGLSLTNNTAATNPIQFTNANNGYFEGCYLAGNTLGLITVTTVDSYTLYFTEGTIISDYAFSATVAADVAFICDYAIFSGTGQFEGSLGTLYFYCSSHTQGEFYSTLDNWSGAFPDAAAVEGRPSPLAILDGSTVVALELYEYNASTTVTNRGSGTAFVLDVVTGTLIAQVPTPMGPGLGVFATNSYLTGIGTAKTYQASVTNMTAECWFKFIVPPFGGSPGDKMSLWGKPNTGNSTFSMLVDVSGTTQGGPVCEIETSVTGVVTLSVDSGISQGRWQHLAITYDGSNAYLYLDGVLFTSQAATGTLVWDNTYSWLVGNATAFDKVYVLRGCRFHNQALSLGQIGQIVNAGAYGRTNI